jgi:pyrroloquinoline-quinone synthase
MKDDRAKRLMAACRKAVARLIDHPYFSAAETTLSDSALLASQAAFYPAVVAFPRHLLILLSRVDRHVDRLPILRNVVEEHGDFQPRAFHHETFARMLRMNGVDVSPEPAVPVAIFNATLSGICSTCSTAQAAAALGAIELGFSPISKRLGAVYVKRRFVPKGRKAHYDVHATLDIRHAADLIRTAMALSDTDDGIVSGFEMGTEAFLHLYDGLMVIAETAGQDKRPG